jgi:hypothetical protein
VESTKSDKAEIRAVLAELKTVLQDTLKVLKPQEA